MRQHFVPKSYLDFFVDETGQLHVYDKKDGFVRPQPPKSTAVVTNYYTFLLESGERSNELEEAFGKVESKVLPMFSEWREGDHISDSQRNFVAEFVALQILRVPGQVRQAKEVLTTILEEENRQLTSDRSRFLNYYRQFCELQGEDYEEATANTVYEFASDPSKYQFEIPRPYIHAMNLGQASRIASVLLSRSWSLRVAPRNTFFITSDSPVNVFVPLGDGSVMFNAGLALPNAEIRFPVSPELCLEIDRVQRQDRFRTNKKFVYETNRRIAYAAERWLVSPVDTRRVQDLVREAQSTYGKERIDKEDFLRRYRAKRNAKLKTNRKEH